MKHLILFLLLCSPVLAETTIHEQAVVLPAWTTSRAAAETQWKTAVTHPCFDSEWLTADERERFVDRLTEAEQVRGLYNMGMSRQVIFDAQMLIAERRLSALTNKLHGLEQLVIYTNAVVVMTTDCHRAHCDLPLPIWTNAQFSSPGCCDTVMHYNARE